MLCARASLSRRRLTRSRDARYSPRRSRTIRLASAGDSREAAVPGRARWLWRGSPAVSSRLLKFVTFVQHRQLLQFCARRLPQLPRSRHKAASAANFSNYLRYGRIKPGRAGCEAEKCCACGLRADDCTGGRQHGTSGARQVGWRDRVEWTRAFSISQSCRAGMSASGRPVLRIAPIITPWG